MKTRKIAGLLLGLMTLVFLGCQEVGSPGNSTQNMTLRLSKQECDSMSRVDLARTDSAKFVHDCIVPVFDCEAMRKKIATLDSSSKEYADLAHLIAERCGVDTNHVIVVLDSVTICNQLLKQLADLDPHSGEADSLRIVISHVCLRSDSSSVHP